MRSILSSTALALLVMASLPASAEQGAWQSTPGELPGVWDPALSEGERSVLLDLTVLLPEGADPLRETSNEVLVLRQLDETQVSAIGGATRAARFLAVGRALDELGRLPVFPLLDSLQRQTAAIRYLENLLDQARPGDRGALERRLAEARAREQGYRDVMSQRPPSLIEMAILRRSHRILLAAGFSPPPIERYRTEWGSWIATAMNDEFLQLRFVVSTELPDEQRRALARLQTLVPHLQWHEGEIVDLHPKAPSGLSDAEIGFRVHVTRREDGSFLVAADVNYAALRSLRERANTPQYLPVSFTADIRGGDRRASDVSVRSALCFVSRPDIDQRAAVEPCLPAPVTPAHRARVMAFDAPSRERCDAAFEIGRREGHELYASLLPAPDDCSIPPTELWTEAHTALSFLIRSSRFAPVRGLEDEQPCRLDGQDAGIEQTRNSHAAHCRAKEP